MSKIIQNGWFSAKFLLISGPVLLLIYMGCLYTSARSTNDLVGMALSPILLFFWGFLFVSLFKTFGTPLIVIVFLIIGGLAGALDSEIFELARNQRDRVFLQRAPVIESAIREYAARVKPKTNEVSLHLPKVLPDEAAFIQWDADKMVFVRIHTGPGRRGYVFDSANGTGSNFAVMAEDFYLRKLTNNWWGMSMK